MVDPKPKLVTLCVKLVKIGAQPVARGLNLRPLQLFRIADEAPRRGADRRALDDDRLAGILRESEMEGLTFGHHVPNGRRRKVRG